ncbi:S9 family peptidase [candidate division KSB1 bacterium]|nr:S9 family peptidase [candidate division KSB1 bacterium]
MNTKNPITIFAALVLTLVSAAQAQQSASFKHRPYVPKIATFLQIGGCGPSGVSWDGKDVYFTANMSGEPQVYRVNEAGWPMQLTTFTDGVSGFSLSWAGDQAITTAAVGGNENSQLFWMDPQSGRQQQLIDMPNVQFGNVAWAHDDQSFFFRSNEENLKDFFIYRFEMATGNYAKVFGDTNGVRGNLAINDLSEDDSRIIVARYTSNVNNDLFLVDLKTGRHEQLNNDSGDVVYGSIELMPDGQTIWLTCNDNPSGMSKIATLDLTTRKLEYVNDGWFDTKWEVEGCGFSRDKRIQFAEVNEDGYARMYMRDFTTKQPLPNPPLDGLLGAGGSDKHGNIYVSFSGPTRAPDVWKWNPTTKELKQLTFSIYAGIDRSMFIEPRLVRFESFDKLQIPAFLYLPPSWKQGQPVPFVIDAHGGPEGQARPGFIRNYQYLMLNGYGVLAVNPRGSSGYGRDFMALDNYKKRKDSLKDYKAAADWLVKLGYSAPGMMAIRGGSYGGYVSLGMITEYPTLFSAAVCDVGIANFVTFLTNTASYRRALREAEYGPLSDSTFLATISPIHKAGDVKTPLLLIHGANDPRVPIGEARQMCAAISANGGIVDTLIFADEGHGSAKKENTIQTYEKQIEFFDAYLKPKTVKVKE